MESFCDDEIVKRDGMGILDSDRFDMHNIVVTLGQADTI